MKEKIMLSIFAIMFILPAKGQQADKLLDQLQSALDDKNENREASQVRRLQKPPRPTPKVPQKTNLESEEMPRENVLNKTLPLKNENLEKILSFEMERLSQEKKDLYPRSMIKASLERATIDGSLVLRKDDDEFRPLGDFTLMGAGVGVENQWKGFEWARSFFVSHPLLYLGLKGFSGKVRAKRTGVQNEEYDYTYTLIGPQLGFGLLTYWRELIGIGCQIGFSSGLFNQSGKGTLDSTSEVYFQDFVKFEFRVNISSKLSTELAYQIDNNLTLSRDKGISAHSMALALGLSL